MYTRQKNDTWTPDEIATLRRLFPTRSNAYIAGKVPHTISAIRTKAQALGLRKKNRYFTPADKQYIIDHYPTTPIKYIARHLGRTTWSIINKHRQLTTAPGTPAPLP